MSIVDKFNIHVHMNGNVNIKSHWFNLIWKHGWRQEKLLFIDLDDEELKSDRDTTKSKDNSIEGNGKENTR